jgi:hypothetical protein
MLSTGLTTFRSRKVCNDPDRFFLRDPRNGAIGVRDLPPRDAKTPSHHLAAVT